jgi:hypothetical protein
MTEGYGCYIDGLPTEPNHPHVNNFHEKGWPNKLSNFLKFDKCINFAKAGSGIGYQVSMFMDYINDIESEYNEWDIHIILQLPASCRHSMYRNGILHQIGKGFGTVEWMNLYTEIQLSSDMPIVDDILLNRPYIEAFIGICEYKKIKYKIINFDGVENELFKKILQIPNDLFHIPLTHPTTYKAVCGHPNEIGYGVIAEYILKLLNNEWEVGNSDNFEWEYLGEQRKIYSKNFI